MTASDGVKTRGWLLSKNLEDTREVPLLVFMHENAGNIGWRLPYFEYVISLTRCNILSMAYRGYSYSDPVDPDEEGIKKDADAIIEFLRDPAKVDKSFAKIIHPKLIFAHGRSLGGAVAAYMVSEAHEIFRGLILENTFTSISAMVD